MVNDIMVTQDLQSFFQSKQDRIRNADYPDQMRPKQDRKPLKGIARQLYLDKRVKLSNAEALASSGTGMGLMKPTPVRKKKEKKNET
jgi:hypothetical protein